MVSICLVDKAVARPTALLKMLAKPCLENSQAVIECWQSKKTLGTPLGLWSYPGATTSRRQDLSE